MCIIPVRKGVSRSHAHPPVVPLLDIGIYGAKLSACKISLVQASHRLQRDVHGFLRVETSFRCRRSQQAMGDFLMSLGRFVKHHGGDI